MPVTISINLPQKHFYVVKEDLVKIDEMADEKIMRDGYYWDRYDEYYKVKTYSFAVSWELLGLIGNRTIKLGEFFSDAEVERFPFNFYYKSTASENRSVFLSTWESSINPSLLHDFLERLIQSKHYIQLAGQDKQQIRKLILLSKIMMKYSIRLDICSDPD